MGISEFARRYKQLNYPHNPAVMRNIYLTDVSTSTLVWDEADFTVELYLMHPNAVVVPHSHPFENISIHISGDLLGRREGIQGGWLKHSDSGHIGPPLPIGVWHAFEVGETGAVFYNVSRWNNLSEKDSATRKYIGEPLGPMHKITLASLA